MITKRPDIESIVEYTKSVSLGHYVVVLELLDYVKHLEEQVTSLQARGTELVLEVRRLKSGS